MILWLVEWADWVALYMQYVGDMYPAWMLLAKLEIHIYDVKEMRNFYEYYIKYCVSWKLVFRRRFFDIKYVHIYGVDDVVFDTIFFQLQLVQWEWGKWASDGSSMKYNTKHRTPTKLGTNKYREEENNNNKGRLNCQLMVLPFIQIIIGIHRLTF